LVLEGFEQRVWGSRNQKMESCGVCEASAEALIVPSRLYDGQVNNGGFISILSYNLQPETLGPGALAQDWKPWVLMNDWTELREAVAKVSARMAHPGNANHGWFNSPKLERKMEDASFEALV
jgi:hypothetical protein